MIQEPNQQSQGFLNVLIIEYLKSLNTEKKEEMKLIIEKVSKN